MKAIGLDIGTTTICGVIVDGETGEVLFSRTLPNDSQMTSTNTYEKLQDPEKIWKRICQILQEMTLEHPDAGSIGVTGQMHGILYVDGRGQAVSPLYTWQDESGNCIWKDGKTYAEILSEETGYFAATGFGMTTYYVHKMKGIVPERAEQICTIGDYVAMRLSGSIRPLITPSNAASLGLFDLKENAFDLTAAKKAGLDSSFLPELVKGAVKVGEVCRHLEESEGTVCGQTEVQTNAFMVYAGVPVSAALGDNQASVIGTVKDPETTVLVNVGTGSQISVGTRLYASDSEVELRPLFQDDYIFVGACLCGGRAYAALEQFFRQVAEMAEPKAKPGRLYEQMSRLLADTEDTCETEGNVQVNPQFCGTRRQPELRGSITGISLDNFTPQSLIRGFLYGIAGELYDMYQQIRPYLEKAPVSLVGSGNGIRMNQALQKIFEELFGMKLHIPVHTEEAAYGTALYSMVAAGEKEALPEAQKLIRYL